MNLKDRFKRSNIVYVEVFISHGNTILFTLEKNVPHQTTYTYESREPNPHWSGSPIDIPCRCR
jgi:hypothetical protein